MNITVDEPENSPTAKLAQLSASDLRSKFRAGTVVCPTAGLAHDHVQANLVILPIKYAYDFMLLCQRNPKACPLLEVTETGSPYSRWLAVGGDLRTDLPRYRVYRNGQLDAELPEITSLWDEGMVAFLLGCSFTFEAALLAAGLPLRHLEESHNVPMYITNKLCHPAGVFHGPNVVTMRPMPHELVSRAVVVSSRFSHAHGAPIHIGDPSILGINDLATPDFGHASTIRQGEVPVFWLCGVTTQAVAMESRPELMITHAPGYMLVSDILNDALTDV